MLRFFIIWFSGILLLGWFGFDLYQGLPDGRLHVRFLDVGQGDAVLIETPRGQHVLVDAGPGSNILRSLSLGFLNKKIDAIMVTHFDLDHAEGFLSVLDRYEIGRILISGALKNSQAEKAFFARARAKEIPIVFVRSDKDLQIDDEIFLDFLFPFPDFRNRTMDALNETSVTFRLLYRGQAVLFSGGDMGFAEEEKILSQKFNMHARILKVSHHGSKGSSSEAFLRAVKAETAVISVGRKNNYGHPHPDALSRLEKAGVREIRRTDREGSIEFSF